MCAIRYMKMCYNCCCDYHLVYRMTFPLTIAEINASNGEWKYVLGGTLCLVSAGLFLSVIKKEYCEYIHVLCFCGFTPSSHVLTRCMHLYHWAALFMLFSLLYQVFCTTGG